MFLGDFNDWIPGLRQVEDYYLEIRLAGFAEEKSFVRFEILGQVKVGGRKTRFLLGFPQSGGQTFLLRLYLAFRKIPVAVPVVQDQELQSFLRSAIDDYPRGYFAFEFLIRLVVVGVGVHHKHARPGGGKLAGTI